MFGESRHQRYAAGASASARDVNADGSQVGKSGFLDDPRQRTLNRESL